MLLCQTLVKASSIHGLGCYADEDIKAGQIVWRLDPQFDVEIDTKQLASLPDSYRDFFHMYAYSPLNGKEEKTFILCGDNARHMNHSSDPNLGENEFGENFALRDITKGEELTCDYELFDKDARAKLG